MCDWVTSVALPTSSDGKIYFLQPSLLSSSVAFLYRWEKTQDDTKTQREQAYSDDPDWEVLAVSDDWFS